jgi:hypothetical protein
MLALIAGCAPKTPEQVGDKFVDLYFVEIDQKRALPLTSGLAHSKLEEELSLVEKVRREMTPDQVKPTIHYARRSSETQGDHARLTYDITVVQGRDETKRNALISMERAGELSGGKWTVGNFIVREGHLSVKPAATP